LELWLLAIQLLKLLGNPNESVTIAQMTRSKCLRQLVKGLHKSQQALLSASTSNGNVNFAAEHR